MAPKIITWAPLDIFSPAPIHHKPLAIIILNQELKLPLYLYHQLWLNSTFVIAADGGANRLYDLNKAHSTTLSTNAIIGDLDSLLPSVRSFWEDRGIPIMHDSDQYSTDFTKAVNYIRASPSRKDIDIVVLGGLGGRVDQGLSVLHHLYLFQDSVTYEDGRMYLLSSEAVTFVLKKGKHGIKAKERWEGIGSGEGKGEVGLGKHVGILPLKGESVISTQGLEWDVKDWKTVFGGLVSTSNHVKEETVKVETDEDVLFTIDLNFAGGGD
ncbi:thiamine pyrophosphokinase [Mollisia scopiformis]|uniref:Thiamine pyrophosphokinase n=1 Tax=Mollisia scopiformis TaxID=149040 RepID=A0A194X8J3_MOLSC|nr:thiamine pyrophosphokinase [Mollisia scopiformis]KUJ16486.1 Thiamin pyrophosphokinase [Mollisia scopiformis]